MKTRDNDTKPPKNNSIEAMFSRAMERARHRTSQLLKGPVLAGAMALTTPAMVGCVTDDAPVSSLQQADWVQYEGQRNTEMVSYFGSFWAECANVNTRFGCSDVDVMLKLKVKQVQGADLNHKEVGVVWKNPQDYGERTAYGYYFSSLPDGYEEWHVRVTVPAWRDYFTFNAFYRDGAYHTFYDDNQGEYHVINAGPDSQIIRVQPWENTVVVDGEGVSGKVSLRISDLDWDKRITMLATVDGWNTVLEYGMGESGENNKWYWSQDVYNGEVWHIDLDIPGDYQELQYAVVYHHGVINDATEYGFWANNGGQNYSVKRPVVE